MAVIICKYNGKHYNMLRSLKTQNDVDKFLEFYKRNFPRYYNVFCNFQLESGYIVLLSSDRNDLENGFLILRNDEDDFGCTIAVSKSSITEAYEKEVYAIYNGDIECNITEPYKTGKYFLETFEWANPLTEKGKLIAERMYANGFEKARDMGYGTYSFGKRISPDDPKLKIIEKRTEIDINEL